MNDIIEINRDEPSSLPATLNSIESAIAQASTPEQIKQVIALASAAVAFAESYYKDKKDVIRWARGLKLRAERRMGEILAVMPKDTGGRPPKTGSDVEPVNSPATLADLGIDKKTSSRAQQLTTLDEQEFQSLVDGEVTLKAALGHKKQPRKRPAQKTKAAEHRRHQIDEAQASYVSQFATYARLLLKELEACDLSDKEIELASEVAEACSRAVSRGAAQPV